MLVYKGVNEDGDFLVFDSDDDTTESVDSSGLREALDSGLEISGLHIDKFNIVDDYDTIIVPAPNYQYKGIDDDGDFLLYESNSGISEAFNADTLRTILNKYTDCVKGLYFDDNGNIVNEFNDILVKAPKISKNRNLTSAKKAKNDEFYTQLSDIEKELSHYPPETFKDKIIYCPMDVATTQGAILRSEFVHYFQMHAHELQFKELIATCLHDKSTGVEYRADDADKHSNNYHLKRTEVAYATQENKARGISPIAEIKGEDGRLYYKYIDDRLEPIPDTVINEAIMDTDGNLMIQSEGEPQLYTYNSYFFEDCKPDDGYEEHGVGYGSGDFRSEKCKSYMEQCDIVVTNPPFSLFREFITQIMSHNKKFIIVGNQNAFTYKEVFPLIKDNKIWTGFGESYSSLAGYFYSNYEDRAVTGEHKDGQVRVSGVCWFTNIDHSHRHEFLQLLTMQDWKLSKNVDYPKYDNYDAIDVSKTIQIPSDYDGLMGVPISFIHKYNPEQFEIIGISGDLAESFYNEFGKKCSGRFYVNSKRMYDRIVVKHRKDENGKLV